MVKMTLPSFPRLSSARPFRLPEAYQYYSALQGALGKPYGIAGTPWGRVFDFTAMSRLDTPYGRLSIALTKKVR